MWVIHEILATHGAGNSHTPKDLFGLINDLIQSVCVVDPSAWEWSAKQVLIARGEVIDMVFYRTPMGNKAYVSLAGEIEYNSNPMLIPLWESLFGQQFPIIFIRDPQVPGVPLEQRRPVANFYSFSDN